MRLENFLHDKPLYYDTIDYTRMPRVYEKIKSHFAKTKIIHLIGTNGKGTTGRFLAWALYSLGYRVGHYSSPHILRFNERIWLGGENISDLSLEKAHEKLQNILSRQDSDALSYFEYTTLLAMIVYEGCDYVVMEAGLGGEHDATAVFDKILTLVTPIGMDHEAFLGNTIQDIARTKLNALQKSAILAKQPFPEVYTVAREIAQTKSVKIYRVEDLMQQNDIEKIAVIAHNLSLPLYLRENLMLSIGALKYLNIEYQESDFKNSRLFGRLSQIAENIWIDVGHNPLAAQAILESLLGEHYILVYNSYKDKNYKEILGILKPIIGHVEIIAVDEKRIESKENIQKTLEELQIRHSTFESINPHAKYLVFGSFSVVEKFLKYSYLTN